MKSYLFRIVRQVPNGDRRWTQQFRVSLEKEMTVLDALFSIQHEQDPSLSFRYSCRVGMCGSCAISVNRMPRLACLTRIETLSAETVDVGPLGTLPVLKDLIVSLDPFFEQWKRVLPALHPVSGHSSDLECIPPASEFGRQIRAKRDCITCAACFSACGIRARNRRYLGPAALHKALMRLLDPRDGATEERLAVLNEEYGGVWRCHTQFNCVAACPKGIQLTDSIVQLKRAMLRPGKFREKLHRADRAKV